MRYCHYIDTLSECLSSDVVQVHAALWYIVGNGNSTSQRLSKSVLPLSLCIYEGTHRTKSPGSSETHFVAKLS